MSRSWERMVKKNTQKMSAARKKQGEEKYIPPDRRIFRFKGRNYILPISIIIFTAFYSYLSLTTPDMERNSLFWVTVAMYGLLALLFYFRRPYLAVAKDFVQTRKMTGDKILRASGIRKISTSPGYVVIEQVKGANWIFSRMVNRYPTELMAEKLKQFAKDNNIEFEQKS